MKPFALKTPLPKYRAFAALRDAIIDYLVAENPPVGHKFLTVQELVGCTGLSHMTVRKAMTELEREGWIERHVGRGTFVGGRVEMPVIPHRRVRGEDRTLVRLGMLTDSGPMGLYWSIRLILDGLESAATENALSVEPIISREYDQKSARRRLAQSRPDVLVVIAPMDQLPYAMGDAGKFGIPCITVGSRCPQFRLPNIHAAADEAMAMVVRHLASHGHRRIGLIVEQGLAWAIFDCRNGYLRGLTESNVEPDENLLHWAPPSTHGLDASEDDAAAARALEKYLQRQRPTAVVVMDHWAARGLRVLLEAGSVAVPRDLSVVMFNQGPGVRDWLGLAPTHMARPLREMGRAAAATARQIADGKDVPVDISLPCKLVIGESVGPPAR